MAPDTSTTSSKELFLATAYTATSRSTTPAPSQSILVASSQREADSAALEANLAGTEAEPKILGTRRLLAGVHRVKGGVLQDARVAADTDVAVPGPDLAPLGAHFNLVASIAVCIVFSVSLKSTIYRTISTTFHAFHGM